MNKAKHIIKKQVLNIRVPESENSYGIQERLGRICRQTLPSFLEKVCNTICKEDYWIKLDKVSLDLGSLPVNGLEEAFNESIAKKLIGKLKMAIGAKEGEAHAIDDPKKTSASPLELLKYFLETGALPHWIDGRSVRLEQLFDNAMATAAGEMVRFLRHAPHKNERYKRLAGSLRKQQLKTLATALTKTNAFNTLIDEIFDTGYKSSIRPLTMKTSLLSYLLRNNISANNIKKPLKQQPGVLDVNIAESIKRGHIFKEDTTKHNGIVSQLKTLIKIRPKELAQLIVNAGLDNTKYMEMAALLRKSPSLMSEAIINNLCDDIIKLLSGSTTFYKDIHQLMASAGIEVRNEQKNKNRRVSSTENKAQQYTVRNAGLVILWPGISSLFKACGLIQNNAFVSEAAAERAVSLLQYTVDGRQEVPEFELPLNKLLCGLTIDMPVSTVFEPTAIEKASVQDLLQTVIGEWAVLKNCSPEALQVNYLQREGTLNAEGGHWQLDVQYQTADVLLDRLPWGTGVIKLPWMNHILYTAW